MHCSSSCTETNTTTKNDQREHAACVLVHEQGVEYVFEVVLVVLVAGRHVARRACVCRVYSFACAFGTLVNFV